jgi:hypothetical protein
MKSKCVSILAALVVIFFYAQLSGAWSQRTTPSEPMVRVSSSSGKTRVTLVIRAKSRLVPGGVPIAATLQGDRLDRLTGVQILHNNYPVRDIEAKLGFAEKTLRTVTFSAKSNAASNTYIIKGISTENDGSLLSIELGVLLESARADSNVQSATIELFEETKNAARDGEIEAKKDKIERSKPTPKLEQLQQKIAQTPAQVPLSKIQVTIQSVTPNPINLVAGGEAVIFIISGNNLDQITAIQVIDQSRSIVNFEIKLGPPSATNRKTSLKAKAETKPGIYQLRAIAGNQSVDAPANIVRIVVKA